jgi:hypothetical protein
MLVGLPDGLMPVAVLMLDGGRRPSCSSAWSLSSLRLWPRRFLSLTGVVGPEASPLVSHDEFDDLHLVARTSTQH